MKLTREMKMNFIQAFEMEYGTRLNENDELVPVLYCLLESMTLSDELRSKALIELNKTETLIKNFDTMSKREVFVLNADGAAKWQQGITDRHDKYLRVGMVVLVIVIICAVSFA